MADASSAAGRPAIGGPTLAAGDAPWQPEQAVAPAGAGPAANAEPTASQTAAATAATGRRP
jgi:hypothetical protein